MGDAGAGSRSGKAWLNDMARNIGKNAMISGPLEHLSENCLSCKDHVIHCMKNDEMMEDNWAHTTVRCSRDSSAI